LKYNGPIILCHSVKLAKDLSFELHSPELNRNTLITKDLLVPNIPDLPGSYDENCHKERDLGCMQVLVILSWIYGAEL
jgi:hypothetical protein